MDSPQRPEISTAERDRDLVALEGLESELADLEYELGRVDRPGFDASGADAPGIAEPGPGEAGD